MKLRTKFSLLISILVIVIVLGVTGFLYIAESRFLIKEMERSRVSLIEGFSQVCKESSLINDEIMLFNYIKLIRNTEGLKYAMLISPAGRVLAHTDMHLLGNRLADAYSKKAEKAENLFIQSYAGEDGKEILELNSPVIARQNKIGIARIGFSQEILNKLLSEALKNTRKRMFLVAIGALVIGILGAFLLTQMMSSPIKKLAKAAQTVGKGNLNYQINLESSDELGELAGEFNRMTQQLKELDHMKSDFVSSVTHELRSPLISLRMFIDLFLKGTAGALTEKQAEYLNTMKKSADRLASFINDLLDVARIERGKIEINAQPTEIDAIIKDLEDLFQPQFDQKKIRFSVKVEPGLPRVAADGDKTRQVITNLLSNAVKFTPENGSITVEVSLAKDAAFEEISVSDTGIGIPSDQFDKIFNKFEQVKGIREKVKGPKGTGLGLAIVKGIVEAQGGKIWLKSELDKGSRFCFTVPVWKRRSERTIPKQ
jgi:signal transduction histidine kinase